MTPRPVAAPARLLVAVLLAAGLAALVGLSGCVGSGAFVVGPEGPSGYWNARPASGQVVRESAWSYNGHPGRRLQSRHYALFTTVEDLAFAREMLSVLEAGHAAYQSLAPPSDPDPRPMHAFLFADRGQWEDFTRRRTGADAAVYLLITTGAYTIDDTFVAYDVGAYDTRGKVAHEGLHQYISRHFVRRPPPFLEEGLAVCFENVRQDAAGRAYLGPPGHAASRRVLAEAVREDWLLPLGPLSASHAGHVAGRAETVVALWYAQAWALAHFLLEGENGAHRPALKRLLLDLAAGTVSPGTGAPGTGAPGTVAESSADLPLPELLQAYTGLAPDELERRYLRHIAELTRSTR